jgi:hypothetical protein
MDPRVWSEIIRPALADRQGWAVFIGTPKGRNAFFELWRRAQREEGWFSMMLRASQSGLLPDSELELARRDLTEEQYAQEFECSFDAAVIGAYYGKLMMRAEAERRVVGVPYDPSALVWTSWDLGIRDATAIWFAQTYRFNLPGRARQSSTLRQEAAARTTRRNQAVVATGLLADRRSSSSASAGVFHLSVLRGLVLRAAATAAISSALCPLRSVPFGKY